MTTGSRKRTRSVKEHKYNLGQLVALNSHPGKLDGNETIMIEGDPLHVPPIMVITGVEIEDKKKKTHHSELGDKIADRIKYQVMWFDNKKSEFITKVLYESLLKTKLGKSNLPKTGSSINFTYGSVCKFSPSELEAKKRKTSTSVIENKYITQKDDKKNDNNKREQMREESLLSFVCPSLTMTGIRLNKESKSFYPDGKLKSSTSEKLIKVIWFNYQQQKYSEAEIPQECLIMNV